MTTEMGPQSDLLTGFKEREAFHSLQQAFAMVQPHGLRRAFITELNTGRRADSWGSHETLTVVRTLDRGLTQVFFLTLEDRFGEDQKLTGILKRTTSGVEEGQVDDKKKVLQALNILVTSAFYGQILFPNQLAEWMKDTNDKIEGVFNREEVKVTPPGIVDRDPGNRV